MYAEKGKGVVESNGECEEYGLKPRYKGLDVQLEGQRSHDNVVTIFADQIPKCTEFGCEAYSIIVDEMRLDIQYLLITFCISDEEPCTKMGIYVLT
ncbi:hypothetical protein U1Q18_017680 [Sarracenia purpurea var. burkii]